MSRISPLGVCALFCLDFQTEANAVPPAHFDICCMIAFSRTFRKHFKRNNYFLSIMPKYYVNKVNEYYVNHANSSRNFATFRGRFKNHKQNLGGEAHFGHFSPTAPFWSSFFLFLCISLDMLRASVLPSFKFSAFFPLTTQYPFEALNYVTAVTRFCFVHFLRTACITPANAPPSSGTTIRSAIALTSPVS